MSKNFEKSHESVPLNDEQGNSGLPSEHPPPYNPNFSDPPMYPGVKGVPPPAAECTPPPEYKENPGSVPYAPTTQTVFVVPMEFTSKSTNVMCPYCNVQVQTRIEHECGTLTWLLCCFVSIFVLCCNFTKDVNHYCPNCQRRLGRYRRPCSSRIVTFVVIVIVISIILNVMRALVDQGRYS